MRFGFGDIPHEQAIAAIGTKDFASIVKPFYEKRNVSPGTATRYANEIREFYTAGSDVLWITFADRRLWWCFAEPEVIPLAGGDAETTGSRYRKVIGSWSDKDLEGKPLYMNELRGSLTTVAGFRGTLCRVREFDYLLRRLNGEETPATKVARDARLALVKALIPLIAGLHWKDFELLVELVFTQGGWRRVSATGGVQDMVDLQVELPLTGEQALVQVKSKIDHGGANDAAIRLAEAAAGRRGFLVYHTGPAELTISAENVDLIRPEALAERAVDVGLTSWIMAKVG